MGTDIDTIFKMLSWNSSEKEQLRGIDEAKKIEYLSVTARPCTAASENFTAVKPTHKQNLIRLGNIERLAVHFLRVEHKRFIHIPCYRMIRFYCPYSLTRTIAPLKAARCTGKSLKNF